MNAFIRRLIERFAPSLVSTYRSAKSEWTFCRQKPCLTPFCFRLIGRTDMQNGQFEPEETKFITKALRKADVFVDIGANIGYYTCLARSLGVRSIAVEPLVENQRYLYANILENGWDDVEVWPLALSSKPRLAELYGGGTGASLISGWTNTSLNYHRSVSCLTLDIILGKRFQGRQLFIKMDVEGAEYSALQGAANVIEHSPRPYWLIEIVRGIHHPNGQNPLFEQTFDLFLQKGYRAFSVGARCSEIKSWLDAQRGEQQQEKSEAISYLFVNSDAAKDMLVLLKLE